MKIYVASSWRNEQQPTVVELLRAAGHEVYDFRKPPGKARGFSWREIDPEWQQWTPDTYRKKVQHPIATQGFESDMCHLKDCDACVIVLPCGRSAHLEAGWAAGAGKKLVFLLADGEPELMYRMTEHLCVDIKEVIEVLKR